ncbi:MAG: flagellar biosynthesis anti-sigma factor FlgM [Deltaproteobacteria bacterium]|jgi:negative regulator of flagellin synthesis FlgM|nr:flagellar biosynthesis anti-sigma factor FlgM [Deltaproteobacteria bacterium]
MKISDGKNNQNIINYTKQVSNNQKVTPLKENTNKNGQLSGEKVKLSEKAGYLNKIREIIQNTPDIREEKVSFLRKKIAAGSYNVSGQEIAEKMLNEFLLEGT